MTWMVPTHSLASVSAGQQLTLEAAKHQNLDQQTCRVCVRQVDIYGRTKQYTLDFGHEAMV
jgi:hypothetical protein